MTDQSGETKLEEDLEEEIRRRIEEIRSGEFKAIPWEEARDILGWDRKPESER